MKQFQFFTGAVLLLVALSVASAALSQGDPSQELIVCGWDEVSILELKGEGEPRRVWSWRANNAADLPDDVRGLFNTTDECKPIDGGGRVLIRSSGGGAAVVEREKSRLLFYGRAANAHSADLLPRNRIAVAASRARRPSGDLRPRQIRSAALERRVAVGARRGLGRAIRNPLGAGRRRYQDIRAYKLRDWETAEPKLECMLTLPPPGRIPTVCGMRYDLWQNIL
jgi:hypothetical protein